MSDSQSDTVPLEHRQRIERLPCWRGRVEASPLSGGITNANYVVVDDREKFVVRLGGDIPVHQVMRFNELATSRAAHAAGIAPQVVHAESGALVIRFIEGKVFGESDVREPANLQRVLALVRRFHVEVPRFFRGPALAFWVFQVLRDYSRTLRDGNSRHTGALARLGAIASALEDAVGPVEIVFGHNDLLAANLIDDGERLWLIDFDYAGFNSPLFDLANLASNNQLSPEQERDALEVYYAEAASDRRWRAYAAMKCASLLRDTMWSMVSEIHSSLDFDYAAYTAENLDRFERTYKDLNAELEFL
ncbi:MAG: phosphotransferase [Gammaproteobacteria bacterium]